MLIIVVNMPVLVIKHVTGGSLPVEKSFLEGTQDRKGKSATDRLMPKIAGVPPHL